MPRFRRTLLGVWRLTALATVLAWHAAAFLATPAHRCTVAARARWLSRTSRGVLRAIGVRCSTTGRRPDAPVVAPNHLGYLDILVLAAQTPAVFVAKREVRGWPVFGWFARMGGTQFIDRERRGDVARVGAQLAPVIAQGVGVVLFLEGTSSDGREVLPFKASLLEPAFRERWPVLPAAISYRVPRGFSAAQEVCWWGDMAFPPHLFGLLSIPRIHARIAWGGTVTGARDRKELAATVRERVVRLHAAQQAPR